jgi:hypothetical protein
VRADVRPGGTLLRDAAFVRLWIGATASGTHGGGRGRGPAAAGERGDDVGGARHDVGRAEPDGFAAPAAALVPSARDFR